MSLQLAGLERAGQGMDQMYQSKFHCPDRGDGERYDAQPVSGLTQKVLR
jgi:hypothetical protein